ncbi:MAG TPA: FtsX-like permease family protein, partial [Gemmatimonadales bacterium]|nr:FtsX-like permease family protein [Gemmatimonadales bacterium]
ALWTAVDPASLTEAARGVVARADPELPLFQVETMESATRQSLAVPRATAWAMTIFAGLALVLALGGIYGVLSYTVGQRSREIGIRMALGATRGRALRLVLRHGLALAGVGLALGLAAALAAARALEGLMVGFSALDPAIYLAVAALLLGATLLAALVPATRAVAVEAGAALREE